jgi:hypothetical protein
LKTKQKKGYRNVRSDIQIFMVFSTNENPCRT